ncbi:MAG TPA: hypothetical protein VH054_18820, partial [Polyangiaceae bacterium]|nr:hypothetical protein [Polyangiaceae bacterium]
MKRVVVLFWLCFSILLLSLARCGGDHSGQPDAQSDAKVDGTTDAKADVGTDGATDGASDGGGDAASKTFNVTGATALDTQRVAVTFDAPPNAAEGAVLAHYSVPGLTLSGTPQVNGNTVTITTSTQAAQKYTMTVTAVTRASDGVPLTTATADFTGHAPFDVTAAASVDSVTMTVTYDAPPNATQATTLANYAVQGLVLSGTPQLNGNVVTITTAAQTSQSYTVKVTNVTRASDGEPLLVSQATFGGTATFNVTSAMSTGSKQMTVTFDAPPDPTAAAMLSNYNVPNLNLSGTPQLTNNTVTITTDAQSATSYTVTVSNVTRASDSAALVTNQATFTGHTSFNVLSASSASTSTVTVTFDAPPDATTATTLTNYTIPNLTLSGKVTLNGSTVTLNTTSQTATQYTVTVANVTRASDAEPLTITSAMFTGRTPFDVSGASAKSAATVAVTFDAPPNMSQATTLANYTIAGLTLSGTPALNGSVVTIQTSSQSAQSYTVSVVNVTRASDGEPLTTKDATFNGIAVQAPTVTNVVASPAWNTASIVATITGTDFATVTCPTGVKLDDLDGAGTLISTPPTSCSVDSDTQITATWPAGLRTNGSTGWNVLVTNTVGSNATSAVKLVPLAGLLVSEVYTGTSGNTDHEFIELYNPTSASIDTVALGLKLHTRASGGADTNKTLTAVTTAVVPSHGFLLIVSSVSASGDAWFPSRDYTYPASLVADGGAYVSLSATKDAKVIDKVG